MAVQRTLIGNIKGPKGDKGDTGDTGARGAGATVTIGSVTTTAYGGNANVTNSGTSTDAVFDFVLPQGAPGETVTDMENLTLSSMTEPSVQFPIPSIGDTGKVVFGKITKWFSDMTTLVATKLNAANVVNNLTTTSSGYALDARMGKTLQDRITSLNDSLTNLDKRFVRVLGSNTFNTGESIFDFSEYPVIRRTWLIVGYGHIVTLTFTSATGPILGGQQDSSITVTSVGDYKVKLSGMSWYDAPFAISYA